MATFATLRLLHMLHTGGECKNRVGWLEEEDIHIFQPKKDPRPLTSHIPKLNHNFQNNRPCLLFFQGRPRIESPLATRARNHLIPIRRRKPRKMACNTHSHSHAPVDENKTGPGSAASSTIESIVKPAEATGGRTRCIECGDYECCCIPCTVM